MINAGSLSVILANLLAYGEWSFSAAPTATYPVPGCESFVMRQHI
jgi:hypothetical protein